MPDLSITCPHCNMRITFGLPSDDSETKGNEFLGFVFTCPCCHSPVSYQANEDAAVEMDKDTFDNFKKAVSKKLNNAYESRGAAFKGASRAAEAPRQEPISEDIYENMLRDIRESNSFDDFLKRIEN